MEIHRFDHIVFPVFSCLVLVYQKENPVMEVEEALHRDSPSEMDTVTADSESEAPPAPKARSPRAQAPKPRPRKGKKTASPVPAPEKGQSSEVSPEARAQKPEQPLPHTSARENPVQPGQTPTQPRIVGLAGAPNAFPGLFTSHLYNPVFVPIPITVPIPVLITVPVASSPFMSVPVPVSVASNPRADRNLTIINVVKSPALATQSIFTHSIPQYQTALYQGDEKQATYNYDRIQVEYSLSRTQLSAKGLAQGPNNGNLVILIRTGIALVSYTARTVLHCYRVLVYDYNNFAGKLHALCSVMLLTPERNREKDRYQDCTENRTATEIAQRTGQLQRLHREQDSYRDCTEKRTATETAQRKGQLQRLHREQDSYRDCTENRTATETAQRKGLLQRLHREKDSYRDCTENRTATETAQRTGQLQRLHREKDREDMGLAFHITLLVNPLTSPPTLNMSAEE
ncbi:hypothetical protein P4O66_002652 [Electrophorus voltai]|uniref:Uncharacterized protein n=1 Tax=Electrophorus voltai TaxID=2609070 RepID=A0AAD8YWY5_9TELE|nr:hypothetical protein P4O66_002652 [Electrophorus voltai]